MIRLVLFILLTICVTENSAQIISSLTVSEDTISIGEEISVYYKLTAPKSTNISSLDFSILDSLNSLTPTSSLDTSSLPYFAEIEWRASFLDHENKTVPYKLVLKNDLGSKYEYKDTFEAVFWDLGFYELLHPHINVDSSAQSEKIIRLETPTVLVNIPPIINPDTTSVILPIKDIIVTPKTWRDYLNYVYFILLPLLVALFLLYLYANKKKKEQEIIYVAPPKKPAHVIALMELDKIANEKDWIKGKVKKYQSDLTRTIREYLENRYNIHALESTTDEISRALAQNSFSKEHETDLIEILQIADMVKFAKALPAEDLNETFLEKAIRFVHDTKEVISITEPTTDAK